MDEAGFGYGDFGYGLDDLSGSNFQAFDDTITGNANANELVGGTGDDTLNGLAGDDVLEGGGLAEANVLDCGAGDGDIGFGQGTGTGNSRTNCEF